MRCEDFPCCGHEPGCCPDYDDNGRQSNMRCTCGSVLPLECRYSICNSCMDAADDAYDPLYDDFDDFPDDFPDYSDYSDYSDYPDYSDYDG